jgi:hypothetical protein
VLLKIYIYGSFNHFLTFGNGIHGVVLRTNLLCMDFLWIYIDHHVPNRDTFFENDMFFLIYAVFLWLCIMLGSMYAVWPVMYIGFGILAYRLLIFSFMKCSFIKDLNGLEIVIMYFRAIP